MNFRDFLMRKLRVFVIKIIFFIFHLMCNFLIIYIPMIVHTRAM